MKDSRTGLVSRYAGRRARVERRGWNDGPSNAIDRLIDYGHSAVEISHELDVPKWVVVERFAARELVAA